MTGPLDGLGIVEIGSIGPGPFCAMGWRTSAPTCSASTARPVAVSSARTPTTGPSCSTGAWSTVRGTNIVDCGAPFYDVYETSDGRWLSVAALEPQLYRALIELLGLDDHPGMLRRVNDALEAMMFAGRLNPLIGARLLLAEGAEALRILERREAIGKIVVDVPGGDLN